MENDSIALKIYNNFGWRAALQALENNNYTWASGDKPTSLYYNYTRGTIFIKVKTKTITKDLRVNVSFKSCNYYIRVE